MYDPTLDDEEETENTIHETDIDEVERDFFGDYCDSADDFYEL